jgi:hypothetical protein
MKPAGLKYIFYACSLLLLVVMLVSSLDAGISCDEVLHYGQSEAVWDYFTTGGADQSAVNTPETHLKYYGQSYDNLVTFLAKWFSIDDIYTFRHLMSALAGWLTIFITGLFAVWISGYRSGIIVILLFAVSPTYLGHAQNNLKDIPFALGYIAGLFFSVRLLFSEGRIRYTDVVMLIVSIAFCISIRAGGLLLVCYLFFFYAISLLRNRTASGRLDYRAEGIRLALIILVSVAAFMLGIILWPYALQSPVNNVAEAFKVMARFPSTFREIFEGKVTWSDQMPWYYLPKYMAITIPSAVWAGAVILLFHTRKLLNSDRSLIILLVLFTLIFPVSFVLINESNIYSSWRQFLFVYPSLVLVSAIGFNLLAEQPGRKIYKWIPFALILILGIHPVRFMAENTRYSYIYYNEFTGGLKGAYGNYETDYYYISQTEASEWLKGHLAEKGEDSAVIAATFTVAWQFRDLKGVTTKYIRNEERSMDDWDYAIIANRYIHPGKLKSGIWPPEDAIHVVYASGVPLCAVLKRKSHTDYEAFTALESGDSGKAAALFRNVISGGCRDEMIFYNFARALYNTGLYAEADSALGRTLELNPDFEPALMYMGNIAAFRKQYDLALDYYSRLIRVNSKYFQAYVESAKIMSAGDIGRARDLLKRCLAINPGYKPALILLADSYREADPELARRYDEILKTIK